MADIDDRITVVREWVEKADNDLKNASHTLKLGADCPTDTVCFHAQQCVEKYLKALLVLRDTRFPKTHSISELLRLLPKDLWPRRDIREQEWLTDFAVTTRYPGDYEFIPLTEAREAVLMARRVRQDVRKFLPPKVLKSRKQR